MSKKSRRILSVFLVVLMLLTSAPLQGFVGLELPDWFSSKAKAADNVTTYGIPAINGAAYTSSDGTAAYGTPVFDGTRDRWFLWQNGDDYTKVYYPSHIYLDVTESLESAGYNWEIEWVFGGTTDYRTFLGANIWGDHSQWSDLPDNYYVMNNIFSDYAVDVSVPQGTDSDGGVYGRTSSSANYDVRVVGYDYCSSEQGTDSFTYNNTTHSKYVLLRSRQDTNYAYLYLKGNPSSSYAGKTSSYSTEDYSFGGYGYAQKYGSGWSTHESGSNVYYGKGDGSSYTVVDSDDVTQNEMAWKVTVYDKSALNTLINTAISMRDDAEQYTDAYRAKLASAITTAQAVLTKRDTTQSEINKAKAALQAVVGATEKTAYRNKVKVTAYVHTYCDAAYSTLQIYYRSADGTEQCMEKTLEAGTFGSGISGTTITLYEGYIDGFPTKVNLETTVPSVWKTLRLEDFQLAVGVPVDTFGIIFYQTATDPESFEITSGFGGTQTLSITQDVNSDGSFVEGACGDALTWTLNTAGVLEITGEGDMLNCSEYMLNCSKYMSWDDLRDLISVVMIDSGATSICSDAFTDCTNLEIVKIPDTVTEIAENAFDDCTSLEAVYYGGTEIQWKKLTEGLENSPLTEATVYYNVEAGMCGKNVIGVLDNETNVLTIRGEGDMYPTFIYNLVLVEIDTRPWFSECESIETVIIEEGVTSISAYSFEGCKNITEVEIPDSVTTIGLAAFGGAEKLQTVDLPDNLSYIGYGMFSGCTSLSYVEIPDGVTYIGSSAFNGCTALTSVQLPEGVTTVYNNVFDGCTKLKTVILPDSLTYIGNKAFNGCTALVNVVLPDALKEIGYSAFNGCTGLTEINYPSALTTCNYENSFFYRYGPFYGSGITSISIPDGVTSIPANTFSWNTSLTSIEIPATVTSIGNNAFYFCSSLTDVYFYGSEEQWNNISIGTSNGKLTGATVHFVKTYSAEAAAEYGKKYALSYNKEWPFYFVGGDCANFVSQAIFTSGYDMDGLWHSYDGNDGSNGNFWCDSFRMNNLGNGDKRVATWIRAHELCDYLVSQGGELIYNPSASDFSLGDAVFYDWELDGEIDHSAIVTAIDNGVPKVSGHTTKESCSRLNTHWCYDYAPKNCYLVKLGGGTCYNTDGVAYDCYYVNTKTEIMSEANGGNVLGYIKQYRTARVFEITDGYGYLYYKGTWGWIDLSDCTYRGSWSKIEVSHSMSGWYTVTYPTCQTKGVQQNVCSKCGYTEKRYINAKPHTIVKATCTTVAYCSACGETFGTALGHRYEGTVTKYPTCVETGIKTYSCVRCSKTKTEVLPLDDHTWGDYTVTTEPTCLKAGVSTSVCFVCSKTQTAAIDPLGHDIVSTAVAPTCTAQGYTVNDCQRDGCTYSSITDYTEATGHSLSPNDEGYEDSEDKMELISSVTGICGDDTVDTYQCTHINNDVRCTYTVVIGEATNHNMSDWYTETEATCTDKGLNVTACQNEGCTYRETEETEALGHDIGDWTDNGDGTHTKKCQREGCDYSETEDCTFGEWTVTAEATCTEDGQQERVCTLCGHTEVEAIEALGHDYGDWTDNGDGTHTKVCSRDESHNDTREHTYGDGVMTVPATCEIEGTVEYTCEDCGSVVTEAIDPIGHNYVYNEEYSYSATCTEDGRNYYVCENNPEHIYYDVVSAYGHTMSDWTDYPPENGCGEGRKVSECTNENCDYYEEEYYIIEHNFGDEVEVEGTCIMQSYKYQECTDCGYSICYGYGDVDPDNHSDYESGIYDVADATCTQDGYTGDLVCEACYAVLEEGEVIPALGHDWDDYICNDDGTHTKECQREGCGYSEIEDCTFGEGDIIEAPTCTEDGTQELTCEYCGYTKTEAVSATGHDWDDGVIDPSSTCNTHGTKTYTCKNDESHTYTEEVALDPENHQGETYVANEKSATCTEDGYTGDTYCADCDTVLEEGEVIPATGHDWDDWFTVTEAICEEDGLERRICKNDSSHIEENVLPATGHDWDDGVIDPSSTCNTHGTKTYTCKNDESHTYTEEVALDPENHQGETYVANEKSATCTEDGYTGDTYCADCDTVLEEGEVIPATGHDWDDWFTVTEATCEEDGLERRICKNDSSHIEENVLSATGHDWDDGVIDPSSTCNTHGTKTYTCHNDSSHTYTEEVPLDKNNHVGETSVQDAKEATCTEEGYTGDTYCSDCDALLEEGEAIPATGHDWDDWFTVTEATCEEDGLERRICKNDSSHIEENVLPATGHDWDDGVIDPSSTCNTHGTKTYTCKNDESHNYTEEVALDPENHQGETYVANEKSATCTEDGYTGDTYCADCDTVLVEGEVIPATGHDYSGEWVVTVKADCENNGTKELSCERCREVISTATIIAREHSWSDWKVTKQPTIDEEGVKERECQNTTATDEYDACGKKEAEPIAKLVSYTVTFIAADENGTYEYEGVNYKLVKVVPYAAGTKTIVAPTVPKKTGYIGVWEDYELEDKDIVVKAVYTMESSDEQSEIITEKEVSELENGVARITLSAFSEKLSAIVPMGATPYDIVLVLDQSTSMINNEIAEGVSRMKALKATANSFISKVYDSALKNNVDHRISIVGFSGNGSSSFTGLYANDGTFIHYNNLSGNVDAYEKAYTVVNTQENRDVLTEKINSLGNKQGTCANLGLEIAQGVIANNKDEGRKTIVLFITDGEPTTSGSSYDDAIGSPAILNAYEIKNTLGATIYSVGVSTGNDPANCTSNMDKFMHSVSSNYPEAKGINSMGTADALKGYYVTAENEETLDGIFDDVVAQNITNTIPFTKITFFDTVSKYFTLTIEQEEALRDYVYNEYGVTSDDIEITRNADETTTIVIDNITPKAVYDENGVQTGYGASVVFEVSANKNALEAGIYETNTEDAGLEYEGTQVDSFEVPQITVESDRYIVEFIVDGETFAITEYNKGDTIVAPDCDYANWNIGEGTVVSENYVSFTAQLEDNQKVILWYIGDSVVTQIYQVGTLITPPEVIAPEGKSFESWNASVPVRMPDENLEFYAIFSEHTHSFSEKKTGNCLDGITVTRTCDCGYSESETTASAEHTLTATITEKNKESVACMTCTLCGYYEEKVIEYKASYSENARNAVDLTMYKADIAVQPGEGEKIVVRLYIKDNNKLWSNRNKLTVYRVNENGENEPVTSKIDGSYLVLYLDHFSYFAITVDGVDEIPTYNEITCTFNGHSYSSSVTPATCTSKGYTTHTCTSCGDNYTDSETEQTAHSYNKVVTAATCTSSGYTTYSCKSCTYSYTADRTDALGHNYNSSGICERCGDNRTTGCDHMCHKSGINKLIWNILKVFFKLFKIQPVCDCGAAHY